MGSALRARSRDLKTLTRAHGSLHEDMRVVRRNGLQPRITHDDAEFDAFYRNDYVPYARTRHGEDSFVHSQAISAETIPARRPAVGRA